LQFDHKVNVDEFSVALSLNVDNAPCTLAENTDGKSINVAGTVTDVKFVDSWL
jgi:hypothetical protein